MAGITRPIIQNVRILYPNAAGSTGTAISLGASTVESHVSNVIISNPGTGISKQGDATQEDYYDEVTIDSPLTVGYTLLRTTTPDVGGQYLSRVKVTDTNHRNGQTFILTSSAGSQTAQPFFCNECIADTGSSPNTTSDSVLVNNIGGAIISFVNSWLTNGSTLTTKACVRCTNCGTLTIADSFLNQVNGGPDLAIGPGGTEGSINVNGNHFATGTAVFFDTSPTVSSLQWGFNQVHGTFANSTGAFFNAQPVTQVGKLATNQINVVNEWISSAAPTVSSGFNSGSASSQNGTAEFVVTIGSGTAGSTGVISLPNAATGWHCSAENRSRADLITQSANTVNSATLQNWGTTFAATNWTNGDILLVRCGAL